MPCGFVVKYGSKMRLTSFESIPDPESSTAITTLPGEYDIEVTRSSRWPSVTESSETNRCHDAAADGRRNDKLGANANAATVFGCRSRFGRKILVRPNDDSSSREKFADKPTQVGWHRAERKQLHATQCYRAQNCLLPSIGELHEIAAVKIEKLQELF
jgi:hypothetical protein